MRYSQTLATLILFLLAASLTLQSQVQDRGDVADAQLVSFVDLAYPAIARVARVQGLVVVEVHLDDKGEVMSASAISGPKPLALDCVSNAKKWRFKPNAQRKAVVVYEFRLDDGACHDASHSLFLLRYQNFASITACAPVIGG